MAHLKHLFPYPAWRFACSEESDSCKLEMGRKSGRSFLSYVRILTVLR